ncbi:MAG: efflux RND transporter periplasmic adaptor subunit [Pirellulales bacterium]|nr:efflux RND transporter periplasmic adaptor subunit [Pirellulales bacterium]
MSYPVVKPVIDYRDYTVRRIDPLASVEIRARVSGYLDSIHFKPGDEVKKGDLLFIIDPRPYQAAFDEAKSSVAALDARLKRTTNDMNRADQLIGSKAISQEDYDRTVAAKLEAAAGLQGAQATLEKADLDLKWTKIEAPLDGRISRNLIDAGNLVAADTTLLTDIVDSSAVFAYFDMDEQTLLELIKIRIADANQGKVDAKFVERQDVSKLSSNLSDVIVKMRVGNESDFSYSGKLDFVDNQINPSTGTLTIRAKFPNPKKAGNMRSLVAGGHGDIRVPLSDEYQALLVPDSAIQFDQSREVLYIVNDKDVVVSKPVKKGELYEGMRIIREEKEMDPTERINPTDRIIVEGAIRVRPGAKVKPVDAAPPAAKKEAAKSEEAKPKTGDSPKAAEAGK